MSRFSTRPSVVDDAPVLAVLMEMADRAYFPSSGYSLTLGGTREHQLGELAKLARATARSGFHYSHFEVAVNPSGEVVAGVAGFDKAAADNESLAALEEIGWTREEVETSFGRIAALGACFPEDLENSWTIEHVAVLPAYRGHGLAARLLGSVLDKGKQGGFRTATVDVFTGNEHARRVYLNAGFEPVCTFGEIEFSRILNRTGLERLVKLL